MVSVFPIAHQASKYRIKISFKLRSYGFLVVSVVISTLYIDALFVIRRLKYNDKSALIYHIKCVEPNLIGICYRGELQVNWCRTVKLIRSRTPH